MGFEPVPVELDEIARQVVDAAFKVHTKLGAGLLESIYESCLEHELRKRGLRVQRQLAVDVMYDELKLEGGFRIDLLVEGHLVVEIKAVERMHDLFKSQLLTYLKLTGLRLGLLIDFNVPLIKDGIHRLVR